jgi:hypothetical protein
MTFRLWDVANWQHEKLDTMDNIPVFPLFYEIES